MTGKECNINSIRCKTTPGDDSISIFGRYGYVPYLKNVKVWRIELCLQDLQQYSKVDKPKEVANAERVAAKQKMNCKGGDVSDFALYKIHYILDAYLE